MSEGILVLNAGSSSIKFAVYDAAGADAKPHARLRGEMGDIGREPWFHVLDGSGRKKAWDGVAAAVFDHESALAALLDWLDGQDDLPAIEAVGHRVVHGGMKFREPVVVTDVTLGEIARLAPLAPHHQPHNAAAIRAVAATRPGVVQVACFDTAFHATQPPEAVETGLPADYTARGIRRYGFHGLSYEYVVGALPDIAGGALPERLIALHLGNGASLCAIERGRSVATTMGFSTLDGVPMATRSGSIDPGALLHLMRDDDLDAEALADLLYDHSGLLGLSGGISADMRTLLDHDEPAARHAVAVYCYRVAREVGSLAAALGGVDALVFTGGVGANAVAVREDICRRSAWLGVEVDPDADRHARPCISTDASRVAVYAFDTDEELVIARHTRAAVDG